MKDHWEKWNEFLQINSNGNSVKEMLVKIGNIKSNTKAKDLILEALSETLNLTFYKLHEINAMNSLHDGRENNLG